MFQNEEWAQAMLAGVALPPSVVIHRSMPPAYTTLGSVGDTARGKSYQACPLV